MKEKFYSYIQNLQDQICKGLEAVEGQAKFSEDLWQR
ncbi:MAG TPA: coproporphyrinogen III oxidase, partial [Flavobacterium sp.]